VGISEEQTPQAAIFTSISLSLISGIGISLISNFRGATIKAAFINKFLLKRMFDILI
jgi:hypothetical protein